LTEGVANAKYGPSENLTTERVWVNYRAHIGVGQEIDYAVLSCFQVNFDLGKRGHVGMGNTVAGAIVLGDGQEALARKRCGRGGRKLIDFFGEFVPIVNAAELNGPFCGLSQAH